MRFVPELFKKAREKYGWETKLPARRPPPADPPLRRGPAGARTWSPAVIFGWKTPPPAENQESFRIIRQHTTTPIANVGEVFNSIYDCQKLIQEQLIDYIRTTVVHAGGITHLRKMRGASPSTYQVRTGCHGATDMSPVCMAAAFHFDLAVHNFGLQEFMLHSEDTNRVFPHAYSFKDGYVYPGEKPGLGVDIDEALAAKYPLRTRLPAG